jgi:hypothetical protein
MTTLKKASELFLLIILSDHFHHVYREVDRILCPGTNLDLCRFMAMDEKLRLFGHLKGRKFHLRPTTSDYVGRNEIP